MLWRDTIDNLSSYKVAGKAFHTMCYSSDHTLQIGFSFDTAQAAHDMWNHIEQLVACPENISLSLPGKKKKRKERKPPKPAPLPPKSHISQPCCFQHITSVEKDDSSRYYSLKEFLPHVVSNSGKTIVDSESYQCCYCTCLLGQILNRLIVLSSAFWYINTTLFCVK